EKLDSSLNQRVQRVPALYRYGNALLKAVHLALAETAFDEAVALREAHLKATGNSRDIAWEYALVLFDRGESYYEMARFEPAPEWFARAATAFREFDKKWPGIAGEKIRWSHQKRAMSLSKLKR